MEKWGPFRQPVPTTKCARTRVYSPLSRPCCAPQSKEIDAATATPYCRLIRSGPIAGRETAPSPPPSLPRPIPPSVSLWNFEPTLEHECHPVPYVAQINAATKSLLRKEIRTEAVPHRKSLPLEGGVQQWVGRAVVARARACVHMNLRIRAACAP